MGRIFKLSNERHIEVLSAKIFSIDEYHTYRNSIPKEVQCALSTSNYTNKLLRSFAASVRNEVNYKYNINPVISFSSSDAIFPGERFKLKDYKFCVIDSGLAICLESSRMGLGVGRNVVFAKTLVPFYVDLWFKSLIDDNAVVLSGSTFYKKIEAGEIVLPMLEDIREFKQANKAYIEIDEYNTLSKYIPAIGEKEIVLPEGICAIRNEAFRLSQTAKVQFKKITLPQSLRCIEEGTFRGIHELEEVSIHPKNVAFASKDGALYSCKLVQSSRAYILPEKEKSLDVLLLYPPAKTDIKELYVSMDDISIEEAAFADCQLEKITVNAATSANKYRPLIYIEEETFAGCKKLIRLELKGSKHVRFMGKDIFADCNPSISVIFDDVITNMVPQGLVSSDSKTMWYAQSKNDELIVPDGVRKFGYTMQSLMVSESNPLIGLIAAKRNIACFRKIVLPDSFSVIPKETFSFCQKLQEITLSPKTKELKGFTFLGCHLLTQVIAIGLESITWHDFDEKSSLIKVVLGPDFSFYESSFPKATIIEAPKKSKTIKSAKKLGWKCVEH